MYNILSWILSYCINNPCYNVYSYKYTLNIIYLHANDSGLICLRHVHESVFTSSKIKYSHLTVPYWLLVFISNDKHYTPLYATVHSYWLPLLPTVHIYWPVLYFNVRDCTLLLTSTVPNCDTDQHCTPKYATVHGSNQHCNPLFYKFEK